MNVLVTGSYGQLGSEINQLKNIYPEIQYFFTDADTMDITNLNSIFEFVKDKEIDIIVNCAAYTAVDKAEDEPALAQKINVEAIQNLIEVCKKLSVKLIHISTDYVFDGSKNTPYIETDITNPNSVYGNTKRDGENLLINEDIQYIIIRTSWLYSSIGANFVKTILRLGQNNDKIKVVFDQVGTPTYAKNLAEAITKILYLTALDNKNFKKGIYHYSSHGVCSWYDFALKILQTKQIECRVMPVLSDQFPTKAKRPNYSVLDKQKISTTFNLDIPHWTAAIDDCLKKL